MMEERVSIAAVNGLGVEAAVRKAISLAGGLKDVVRSDSRVLIKPNLMRPSPSGMGVTTDSRVTEAVAKVVLEAGARSVVIAEGSAAGYDMGISYSTEESFFVSGTAEVARKLGIAWKNLNRDAFEEVSVANPYVLDRVRIARTAVESDVIISVPVLKTHGRTLVTLSLKNMKGVMPGAEKRKTHRLGLDMAIADLNSVVRPGFVVVDALTGMEGAWQYPQDRREMGLVVAGRDPAAADSVGAYLMGFDPRQVYHLQLFAEKQGGSADLQSIEVVGEPIADHRQMFRSAWEVFKDRYPNIRILEGASACTGCTGELNGSLQYFSDANCVDDLAGLTVVLGNPEEVPITASKTVVLGICCQNLEHMGYFVRGCPPSADDITRAISTVCDLAAESVISAHATARERRWEEGRRRLES